ncbi:MAG: SLC13 family permease [Acidobacteriota bacterium]|nr:SLC13 family permease [Acidobacteriota bacterium]
MLDVILVCAVIVIAFALFASERMRVDLVAMLILASLAVIGQFREGFLSVEEAFSGFSNEATLTIGAMFILSSGLTKTGAIGWVSQRLTEFGGESHTKLFVVIISTAAVVSAFINNTAAVAIFLPVALGLARDRGVSQSKLLMPLSFASIVGGTCTLIGTSTNILVSSLAADNGLEGFSMFELTKLGAVFLAIGLIYLTFVARRFLPDRAATSLTRKYAMARYLTGLDIPADSPLVGKSAAEARLNELYDVTILEIIRGETKIHSGLRDTKLEEGDHLLARGALDGILEMKSKENVLIRAEEKYADSSLTSEDSVLLEGIVSPSSSLVGSTLKEADFRHLSGVFALAINKHGETLRDKVGRVRLDIGDTLLLQGRRGSVDHLADKPYSLVLQTVDLPEMRFGKAAYAGAIIALVVGLAATGATSILLASVTGCLLMVLTQCISLQEAYDAIDWFVIFLLAGVIPLGIAMQNTGTAELIAGTLLNWTQSWGPVGVLAAFYLLTTLFASVMSHNAAAVVLVPIGIAAARELGLDPRPFVMAVTFAASSSLATPFGYHTNLMVYAQGGYRFSDYLRVGVPLNLLLWLAASLLIPVFWPF